MELDQVKDLIKKPGLVDGIKKLMAKGQETWALQFLAIFAEFEEKHGTLSNDLILAIVTHLNASDAKHLSDLSDFSSASQINVSYYLLQQGVSLKDVKEHCQNPAMVLCIEKLIDGKINVDIQALFTNTEPQLWDSISKLQNAGFRKASLILLAEQKLTKEEYESLIQSFTNRRGLAELIIQQQGRGSSGTELMRLIENPLIQPVERFLSQNAIEVQLEVLTPVVLDVMKFLKKQFEHANNNYEPSIYYTKNILNFLLKFHAGALKAEEGLEALEYIESITVLSKGNSEDSQKLEALMKVVGLFLRGQIYLQLSKFEQTPERISAIAAAAVLGFDVREFVSHLATDERTQALNKLKQMASDNKEAYGLAINFEKNCGPEFCRLLKDISKPEQLGRLVKAMPLVNCLLDLGFKNEIIDFVVAGSMPKAERKSRYFYKTLLGVEKETDVIKARLKGEEKGAQLAEHESEYRKTLYQAVYEALRPDNQDKPQNKLATLKASIDTAYKEVKEAVETDSSPCARWFLAALANLASLVLTVVTGGLALPVTGYLHYQHYKKTGDFLFFSSTRSAESYKAMGNEIVEEVKEIMEEQAQQTP
jgi:hypothetical protein